MSAPSGSPKKTFWPTSAIRPPSQIANPSSIVPLSSMFEVNPTMKKQSVVLITGGTAGIGLALAEAYIAKGVAVAICGRSQEALDRFAKKYPEALAIRADVTDGNARAAMLQSVTQRFGKLDVLINNAGTFVERDIATGPGALEGLESEVALNLTAPIQLTGEVLEQWPGLTAVVFVTSGFALVSPKRAPTYGAVKAGLRAFADGLRWQLASRGTLVVEVLPPMVDTSMNANQTGKKMSPTELADIMLKALDRRQETVLPGPVGLLPTLLRLAPRSIKRMVAHG